MRRVKFKIFVNSIKSYFRNQETVSLSLHIELRNKHEILLNIGRMECSDKWKIVYVEMLS